MSSRPVVGSAVTLVLVAGGVLAVFSSGSAHSAQPAAAAAAPGKPAEPKFPPFEQTVEGLEKIISTADGASPLYDLYRDTKTGRLLGVLPAGFDKQLLMVACTVTGGDPEAGVMGPTHYVRWERYDKQLALVAPDFSARTNGDPEAKASIDQLFTGRVILSTPILTMAPGERPVIDLGAIATRDAGRLFGPSIYGPYGPDLAAVNAALIKLTKARAFPRNIVFEYQAPRTDGQLVRFAVSVGELSGTPGFKPRKADPKFGYFYDWHRDFARTATREVTDRYINHWSMEKRDPSLKLSPPKQPIVWYIEHTTPVRFRRYVKEGILFWNEAFREIGFDDALVVYQQDAGTGDHMDKDPEDARFNFFRWNASDQSYAIGPSRSNPQTGEILDADVVWHQGLTRAVRGMIENLSISLTEHAFGPETLAWLEEHPTWDPRLRLTTPAKREQILMDRAARDTAKSPGRSAWAMAAMSGARGGGAACSIGELMALDMSLAGAAFSAGALTPNSADLLEDLPEEFVGQMIRYISAHEVGHCLGLEHNMIASTIRSLKDINTPGYSGATVGSVMDYAAANLNHNLGEMQGPYATPGVGPYDKWVIAYGYGPEDKLPHLRKRVAEADVVFQSQAAIGISGDPRNNTWDLGADNLQFAESRLGLVREVRAKLIEKVVKDGESWAIARRRYQSLLGTHVQMLSIASRWIGGSFLNNDAKGDPAGRTPVQDIPADTQRRALKLVIDNAFEDSAFGLTPELIRHLGKEHFYDPDALTETLQDASYSVHDSIGGIQATALTFIMNPTTLRRLYDNEFRAVGSENPITMAEVVKTVTDAVWREYGALSAGTFTAAKPMVSSLRRNLQREHAERLITLALLPDTGGAALRAVSTLAMLEIGRVDAMAEQGLKASPDPYTRAHLEDLRTRFARTREAAYQITP